MSNKNKKRRNIIAIGSSMAFILLLFGLLIYLKFYGFNRALKELVFSKTNGQYTLHIGHSNINALSMSLSMKDVKLIRNPDVPINGVRSVSIAQIKIHLSSISGLFKKNQFDITRFTIDEPIIEIDAVNKKQKDVNLTHQIVKLYPAIESLMERFNIEYFSIKTGSLGIQKPDQSTFKIKLIDLLIEQWNLKNLSNNRQLQLRIGEQELKLGKGNFSFSSIDYNFRKRQLRFSNFNYSTLDSLTQSKSEITGEYLQLERLEYSDLLKNQKLIYEKAIIENPIINLHLKLKENKEKKSTNENELIARLVKQAIGDCLIDSIIINNAKINAILEHEDDSLIVNIQSFDFKLHTLKVEEDSSTLQIGEIGIEMKKPAITLKNGTELSCSKLIFDRQKNLSITEARIFDTKGGKKIASCETVKLRSFRLLHFLFYNELFIESISLNNVDIQILPETFKNSGKKKNSVGLKDILIGTLAVNNTRLNYTGAVDAFTIENISLDIRNINKQALNGYQYDINKVQLDDAVFNIKTKNTSGHLNKLYFDGTTIKAGEIILRKDSFNLLLLGLNAISTDSHHQIQDYTSWSSIIANNVNVTGKLPAIIANNSTGSEKTFPAISIEQTIIDNLSVSVYNEKMNLKLNGKNLSISAIVTSSSKKPIYGKIIGTLSQVKFTNPEMNAGITDISIHLPENILMKNVKYEKDKMKIASASVFLQSISQVDELWSIKNITLTFPDIFEKENKLFTADSIKLSDSRIFTNADPSLGNIEIYNPDIRIPEEGYNQTSTTKNKNYPFNILNNFTIHPGILHLNNNKTIDFGLIKGNLGDRKVWCASFYTEMEKLTLRLNSLHLSQNKLLVDSFFIKSNEEWYAKNNIQDTRLNTSIFGLQTTGFSIDSIISTGKIMNLDFSIDSSIILMSRDKRLPDPPEIEKSASLSGLLWLPENMSIHSININKTNINYTEVSKKTGDTGVLELNDITASAKLDYSKSQYPSIGMNATSKLYKEGIVKLNYETVDSMSFSLDASVNNFDLTKLNKIVVPDQSLEIKSGYLNKYNLHIIANNDTASGNANITYKDLHLIIFKSDDPERKNLGSDLLTFLADGIILQHNKTNATIKVKQPRVKYKSTFNYWVKSAIHGAMGAVRKGKEIKVSIHPQVKIK